MSVITQARSTIAVPAPRFYLAVAALSAGTMLTVLDGSIANLALPVISQDMHIARAASIWIVSAYQLAVVMVMLPLASLGEIIGYRLVFLAGLGVFILASLLCVIAPSLLDLAAARGLQGLGGAGVMCVGSALVRIIYPPARLGRGIGVNAMAVAVALAAGPAIAGFILSITSWRWLFAINLPLGLLTFVAAYLCLPDNEGQSRPFDLISAALNALTFGLFIIGIESFSRSATAAFGGTALIVSAGCALIFYRRQIARETPLLPLDLLQIPVLRLSIVCSIIAFIAQMLAFVALPFLFRERLGLSPAMTGLLLTPWPVAAAIMAPIAGAAADRLPAGFLGWAGLLVAAAGLVSLSQLTTTSPDQIIWRVVLCGVGFALFQSPNTRIIVSASPKHRAGGAGGMIGTARVLGQSIGAATAALIFHECGDQAETIALRIATCASLVAAFVSLIRLTAMNPVIRRARL